MGKKSVKSVSSLVEDVSQPIVSEPGFKKSKPFLFDDTEIEDKSNLFRDVMLVKRANHLDSNMPALPKGVPLLIWKLVVAVKVAQRQPWILKYGVTTCKLCGSATAWSAVCSWLDRYYDKASESFKERNFVIQPVCESCLQGCGALYMMFPEWLDTVLTFRGSAQYERMHNAKDYQCALCQDHASDSTMIHLPWNKMLLNVPVCDKHFDSIVGISNSHLDSVGVAEAMAKDGNLSPSLVEMLKAYQPLRNKNKKKVE